MRIVHFSKTPLAGAPIRLIQALRQHTDLDARLVQLEPGGQYEQDLVHSEHCEQVVDLAEKADVIHLHDGLDYRSKEFHPVDFDALRKTGKLFLRQFHSVPSLVGGRLGVSVGELLASSIPSVVIAQFPERFYPQAMVVPNIIPQDAPLYRPGPDDGSNGILFSPTSWSGAWEKRWHTKGTPDTVALLKRVARRTGCAARMVMGQPLAEVLDQKRKAGVVIDELVTGSYHLSGLEGLSLGKPVLSYLDDRTKCVLGRISGTDVCPFINVRLEEAFEVLTYLVRHPDERADLGRAGRAWIERHWADRVLVRHFVDAYEKLAGDPTSFARQQSLRLDGDGDRFRALSLPDLIYRARARGHLAAKAGYRFRRFRDSIRALFRRT